MSQNAENKKEHPSTYMVQDLSNTDERMRVMLQDQMLTTSMGGPLPEQPETARLRRVLDIGCGSGYWLIETAKAYPEINKLIGIDISKTMVEFAREQAVEQQVADRVEFHVMDALGILEFPKNYFDLVNQRLAMSWLRTWDWPKILGEYLRITRAGGIVRITEACLFQRTTSPALNRFAQEIWIEAFFTAGYFFSRDSDNIISQIPRLLEQNGLQNLQTRPHNLEYRAGTPEGQHFIEDIKILLKIMDPFLRKWTRLPADYHDLCQQILKEIDLPDFYSP